MSFLNLILAAFGCAAILVIVGALVALLGIKADNERATDCCHRCGHWFDEKELTLVQCGLASGRFCSECIRILNARRGNVKSALVGLALMAGVSASGQCDIDLGRAGSTTPLVLHLQAGVAQTVLWDFTGCTFGIQNFTVYATQPRPCPSCLQKALPKNTPLMLTADGQNCGGFVCYLGKVNGSIVEVILLSSRKLDVELTYTAAFGGAP